MTVCQCPKTHLIGLDGGLRHIDSYMVPDLLKLGWHIVNFPKRNYFPEFDKASAAYRETEVIGDVEEQMLEVDLI